MGKSKARILRKGINNQIPKISREEALLLAVGSLENRDLRVAKRYISIFGFSAEELLEAGAGYEDVVSIKNIF